MTPTGRVLACAPLLLVACKDAASLPTALPTPSVDETVALASEAAEGSPGPSADSPESPGGASAAGDELRDFEQVAEDALPAGWSASVGDWRVRTSDAPQGKTKVLAQRQQNPSAAFNLALAPGTAPADLDISVKLRAVAGRVDQGGGLVWRALDARNYYVARFNPLEDNYRVYTVENGRRSQLGNADIRLPPKTWHALRVRMVGTHIECFINGEKLLDTRDDTFMAAGSVGLWTKADAQTEFDDLLVTDLTRDRP